MAGMEEPLVDESHWSRSEELRSMVAMGWPMLVSFFCRLGMAATDAAFCGHVTTGGHTPGTYLAAATLSDMVTNILTAPPLAFSQGLNALVSQALGANNKKLAGRWLQLSVVYLAITHIPALIAMFYVDDALLFLGFSAEISELAGTYAKWNVFWPIPNGWYQCMRFYFQAMGVTKPAMYNNIVCFFINVGLNYLFVFKMGFGFVGAAMSISCSRILQPLFYWLYMFFYKKAHIEAEAWVPWSWDTFSRSRRRELERQAVPQIGTLIFQSTVEQVTTLLIAGLGTTAIAASSAVQSFTMIWNISLNATLAAICGVRVGFHVGAQNAVAAKNATLLVLELAFWCTLLCGVPSCIWARPGLAMMTSDNQVIDAAVVLMPALCLGAFGMIVVECLSGGCFTSQGRVELATIISMGVALPSTIGAVFLCVHVFGTLLAVMWGQTCAFYVQVAVCLFFFYRSNWEACVADAQTRQEKTPVMSPATFTSPSLVKSPLKAV